VITGTLGDAAFIGHVGEWIFGETIRFWWQVRVHNPRSEYRGVKHLWTSAAKFDSPEVAEANMVERVQFFGGILSVTPAFQFEEAPHS